MGKSSRDCGNRGERAAQLLLESRDWKIQRRQHGDSGDDGTATDPQGKRWSVEIKNTKAAPFVNWCKAVKNARERDLPLLFLWHPKNWGFPANLWIAFMYEPNAWDVHVWRGK